MEPNQKIDQSRLQRKKKLFEEMEKIPFYSTEAVSSADFITKFKDMVNELKQQQKHQIRKYILNKLKDVISIQAVSSCQKSSLSFDQKNQLVSLLNCQRYHVYHIVQVAKIYHQKKQFTCEICKTTNTKQQIFFDAFTSSYLKLANRHSNSNIFFKTHKLQNLQAQQQINHKILHEKQQLFTIIEQKGTFECKQLIILNLTKQQKSKQQQDLPLEKLVDTIKNLQQKKQQYINFFKTIEKAVSVNMICFMQNKRINNPLFHLKCIPEDHDNRLCLYSLDYVYFQLYQRKKNANQDEKQVQNEIKCFYPTCNNTFTRKNFDAVAGVSAQLRRQFYKESKYLLRGQFNYNGVYNKNSDFNKIRNNLQSHKQFLLKNQGQDLKMFKQIEDACNLIVKNMYADRKKNPDEKFYKGLKNKYLKNQSQRYLHMKVSNKQNWIAECSGIRCNKCTKQKSTFYDMWYIVSNYIIKKRQKCFNCQSTIDFKGVQSFYSIDVRYNKFLFLNNQKPITEVVYDCSTEQFYNIIQRYKPKQLIQLLKKRKQQVPKDLINNSTNNIVLIPEKQYFALIHNECMKFQTSFKFYIYWTQNRDFEGSLKCPNCSKQLQIPQLYYDQQLTTQLKNTKNNLRDVNPNKLDEIPSIFKIKTYDNLNEYEFKDLPKQGITYFYMRNYQKSLIIQPIVYTNCKHSKLQTQLSDFRDIILQSSDKSKQYMKCRYKRCSKKYQNGQEVLKVPIFASMLKSEQNRKKIMDGQYWVGYELKQNKFHFLKKQQVIKLKLNDKIKLYRSEQNKSQSGQQQLTERLQDFGLDPKRIIAMYPTQCQKLFEQKIQIPQKVEQQTKQKFRNVKHFGNLLIFDKKQIKIDRNPIKKPSNIFIDRSYQ